MFDRLLRWLAKPYVDEVRDKWVDDVTQKRREAYETGYLHGRAHGEYVGQQVMLAEVSRIVDERHPAIPEVTYADIARAKKGMIH